MDDIDRQKEIVTNERIGQVNIQRQREQGRKVGSINNNAVNYDNLNNI